MAGRVAWHPVRSVFRPTSARAAARRGSAKPQDRQGARPDDPTVAPAAGGSGPRV